MVILVNFYNKVYLIYIKLKWNEESSYWFDISFVNMLKYSLFLIIL